MHRIAKTTKSDDVTTLFKVFSSSGRLKIEEKLVPKQHPAENGLQERLGRHRDSILEPFLVILGPKIGPEEGPKTSCILGRFFRGPKVRHHPVTEAPLGSARTAGGG